MGLYDRVRSCVVCIIKSSPYAWSEIGISISTEEKPHVRILVCHERHKGDGGRSSDGDCTGKPIKQPYAAVVKSYGSEQLGKRLSKTVM